MKVSFTEVVSEKIVRRSKVPPDQAPVCHLAIEALLCAITIYYPHISSSGKVGTFGVACTPKTTKALYPKRLALVDVGDGDIQGHRNELLQALKQGELLRYRSWYRSPEFSAVKSIYHEGRAGP